MDSLSDDALLEQARQAMLASATRSASGNTPAALRWLDQLQRAPRAWGVLMALLRSETGVVQLLSCTMLLNKVRTESISTQATEVKQHVVNGLDAWLGQWSHGLRTVESAGLQDRFSALMATITSQLGEEATETYVKKLCFLAQGPHANPHLALELCSALASGPRPNPYLRPLLPHILALLEVAVVGQVDSNTAAQLSSGPFSIDQLRSAAAASRQGAGASGVGHALLPGLNGAGYGLANGAAATGVASAHSSKDQIIASAWKCLRELSNAGLRLHTLQSRQPALLLMLLAHVADPIDPLLASKAVAAAAQPGSTARELPLRPSFSAACDVFLGSTNSLLTVAHDDIRATRASANRRDAASHGRAHGAAEGSSLSHESSTSIYSDSSTNRGVVLSDADAAATLSALRSMLHALAAGYQQLRAHMATLPPASFSLQLFASSYSGWDDWERGLGLMGELAHGIVACAADAVAGGHGAEDGLFSELLIACCANGTPIGMLRHGCEAVSKLALVPNAKRSETYRSGFFGRASTALLASIRYPLSFPASGNWDSWESTIEGSASGLNDVEWDQARRGPVATALDACFRCLGSDLLRLLLQTCPLGGPAPALPGRPWEVAAQSAADIHNHGAGSDSLDPSAPGAWQRFELLLFVLHCLHHAIIARLRVLDKLCNLSGADPCSVPPEQLSSAPAAVQSSVRESSDITRLLRQVFGLLCSAGRVSSEGPGSPVPGSPESASAAEAADSAILAASPLIVQQACRLIGSYSPWILSAQGNGDLPGQCLAFVARAMATTATATAASSALSCLVARAAPHIASHPDLPRHLVGAYTVAYGHLPMEARRSAGGALVSVASKLPNFADAAGMTLAVARLSLQDLSTAISKATDVAVAKAAGGPAARSKLRTGTVERVAQDLSRPLEVLAGLVLLCSKEPPPGHVPIIVSQDRPACTARHLALMILDTAMPALQQLLAPDDDGHGSGAGAGAVGSGPGSPGYTGGVPANGHVSSPGPGTASTGTPSPAACLRSFLSGTDTVHQSIAGLLVDVGRAVTDFPRSACGVPDPTAAGGSSAGAAGASDAAGASSGYITILSILRAAFRSTQDSVYLSAIGSLATVAGPGLVKILSESCAAAEAAGRPALEGLGSSPAAPVYAMLTSIAREACLLSVHLFAHAAYSTEPQDIGDAAMSSFGSSAAGAAGSGGAGTGTAAPGSPNLGSTSPGPHGLARAGTPPPLFSRMWREGGVYDSTLLLCACYGLLSSLACAVPVCLVNEALDQDSANGAALMIQDRLRREVQSKAKTAALAETALAAAGPAIHAHVHALLGHFNRPLPALLGLMLDHGLSIVSELDRRSESQAVLGLLSALFRLRYGLYSRLGHMSSHSAGGAAAQLAGMAAAGTGGFGGLGSPSASFTPAVAMGHADDMLARAAASDDLNGRGAGTAHAFISPVPLRSLPSALVEPLLRAVEGLCGSSRAGETISVLLACTLLHGASGASSSYSSGSDETVNRHATTITLAAHSSFASACVSGALAQSGIAGGTLPATVPCGLAVGTMRPFVAATLSRAVQLCSEGQAFHSEEMSRLAANAGSAAAAELLLLDSVPGRGVRSFAGQPAAMNGLSGALTLALFGSRGQAETVPQSLHGDGDGSAAASAAAAAAAGQASGYDALGLVALVDRTPFVCRALGLIGEVGEDGAGTAVAGAARLQGL